MELFILVFFTLFSLLVFLVVRLSVCLVKCSRQSWLLAMILSERCGRILTIC